ERSVQRGAGRGHGTAAAAAVCDSEGGRCHRTDLVVAPAAGGRRAVFSARPPGDGHAACGADCAGQKCRTGGDLPAALEPACQPRRGTVRPPGCRRTDAAAGPATETGAVEPRAPQRGLSLIVLRIRWKLARFCSGRSAARLEKPDAEAFRLIWSRG